jgi:hypothetical protein
MGSFTYNDDDRLDWQLFQDGAVTLYLKQELMDLDIRWLSQHGYGIHVIDCSRLSDFMSQMTRLLKFKDNFGYEPWDGNLNALDDAFRELDFASVTGIALCFVRFDSLLGANRSCALGTLDTIERHSRDCLLLGQRLLALVQSDDPMIDVGAFGCRQAKWNSKEWLDADRS